MNSDERSNGGVNSPSPNISPSPSQTNLILSKGTQRASTAFPGSNIPLPSEANFHVPVSDPVGDADDLGVDLSFKPPRLARNEDTTPEKQSRGPDRQMLLMLLEQQNKRRLLMARQDQLNNPSTPAEAAGTRANSPDATRYVVAHSSTVPRNELIPLVHRPSLAPSTADVTSSNTGPMSTYRARI